MNPHIVRSAAWAAVLTGLVAAAPVRAGEVKHSLFTLTYPEKWRSLDAAQIEALQRAAGGIGRPGLPAPSAAGPKAEVFIAGPERNGFTANLNIIVTNGEIPVNEDSRQRAAKEIPARYAQGGLFPGNVQTEVADVGSVRGISIRYDVMLGGHPLRQWQMMVPAGGKTLVITCTARREAFAEVEPDFRQMVGAIRTNSALPDWLRSALIYGAIGGGVGAVMGLANMLRRKAAPAPVPGKGDGLAAPPDWSKQAQQPYPNQPPYPYPPQPYQQPQPYQPPYQQQQPPPPYAQWPQPPQYPPGPPQT